jgi:hypothetical protein
LAKKHKEMKTKPVNQQHKKILEILKSNIWIDIITEPDKFANPSKAEIKGFEEAAKKIDEYLKGNMDKTE